MIHEFMQKQMNGMSIWRRTSKTREASRRNGKAELRKKDLVELDILLLSEQEKWREGKSQDKVKAE